MASIQMVTLTPLTAVFSESDQKINWVSTPDNCNSFKLPHIFFDSGQPWLAANEFAVSKHESTIGNNLKTIVSNLGHLRAYACWLEKENLDWRHFPERKKDRCIFRYRGFLVQERNKGVIEPSTTTVRMNAILNFYRWANQTHWFIKQDLWADKNKTIPFHDHIGFLRTLTVQSSELAIPNKRTFGKRLEDGLLPISDENQKILINHLKTHETTELFLIYVIGFFTGARSETIRTLTCNAILNAIEDPTIREFMRIPIGPGTGIKTKFDVKGSLLFPTTLVQILQFYSSSVRRLVRVAKAIPINRDTLFLTQRGNPYSENSFTKLISDLRKRIELKGFNQFREFKFHQTRATFGTRLMRIAMNTLPNQIDAITFVRDAMNHKHESTTWKYVRFLEEESVKINLNSDFFKLFTGVFDDLQDLGLEGHIDETA